MCDNNNHKRNGERAIYVIVRAPKSWMKIIVWVLIVILAVLGISRGQINPDWIHYVIAIVIDKYVPNPIGKKIELYVQNGADVVIVMVMIGKRMRFFTGLAEPQTATSVLSK